MLARQCLRCDQRFYFKTLIHISYLIHISQRGVRLVCEVGAFVMKTVVILRDKAPSMQFPGKWILCVVNAHGSLSWAISKH